MGNSDLGIRLGVEGERSFKQTLYDINSTFKVLKSEMNLVSSGFDKSDRSMAAVTARSEVLNKQIDAQKNKLSTLEQALNNAATSFGENDRRTQEWAIKLNNAKAELNGMEKSLAENEKSLDSAGKEADQFGDEIETAAVKSKDASGIFKSLGSVLSVIGTAMAAVGAAAAGAVTALVATSTQGAAYADDMLTMVSQTGLSTDSLQEYSYAADLVDVSLDTLTGSMAKQIKSMSSARDGSEVFSEAYKKLGVSITNADGTLRDSEEVYWEVIDALGSVANETERDAIAMQLFGKSAQELNPLIAQGSEGIAALAKEAQAAGAVLSGDALSAFGAYDDGLQRLKQGAGAAQNALGGILLPQLTILAGLGTSLLGEFTSGLNDANGDMSKIGDVIGDVLSSAIKSITEMLPEFINYGLQIVSSVGGAILENLPTLVDAAVQIATTLVSNILDALPAVLNAGIDVVMSLVDGVTSALPFLIPAAVEAITNIVQGLTDRLPDILSAALAIIMTLAEGILISLPQLILALPAIITGIVDFIVGAIPQIIEIGVALLTSLVGALPMIIAAVVEVIPQIIDGIITAVLGAIPLIIDAGISLLISLVEALPTIIISIVNAIPKIIDGIIKAVIGAIPLLIDAGMALFVALIQALPEIIVTILKAIPEITDSIVTALLDSLPLIIEAGVTLFIAMIKNLPVIIQEIIKAVPVIINELVNAFGSYFSRMAEVGTNLIQGLWQGISDAGTWLWKKISGFFGGVVDSIKDFFGISSPSKLFSDVIGTNLALGLGEGFTKSMNGVARDMQNAIPTNFKTNISGTTSDMQSSAVYQKSYNNSPVINFYNSQLSPYLAARELKKVMGELLV